MTSRMRKVGAAGLVLGLGFAASNVVPAQAGTGLLDLGGIVGSLLNGQGGVFGPDGGVVHGDDDAGDVVGGLVGGFAGGGGDFVGGMSDIVDAFSGPPVGGEGSFDDPSVGVGPVGVLSSGLLGGLLGGGGGLLGGVF